jgi:hypothetical protein
MRGAIRGHQRLSSSEAIIIRGHHHQRSSIAIRGHQRTEAIRGHQRSSEVIRGHQRSSEVSSEVIAVLIERHLERLRGRRLLEEVA